MIEEIGPSNVPVSVGARVWAHYANKTFDAKLIGPGDFKYEVEVELGSERRRLMIHRYNVQPQDEVAS